MAEIALTFLSPIIEEVISKASSFVMKQIGNALGLEKELDRLGDSLAFIQSVVQHAEERQESDPGIRRWLQKLKDVAFEAMDVLDEWEYKVPKDKVKNRRQQWNPTFIFSAKFRRQQWNPTFIFSVKFRNRMTKKIKDITEQLGELEKRTTMINLLVTYRGQTCPTQLYLEKTDSFLDNSKIFGREKDVSAVSKLRDLRSNQRHISGISIVGMPGVGKTTVARSVYRTAQEEKLYDKRFPTGNDSSSSSSDSFVTFDKPVPEKNIYRNILINGNEKRVTKAESTPTDIRKNFISEDISIFIRGLETDIKLTTFYLLQEFLTFLHLQKNRDFDKQGIGIFYETGYDENLPCEKENCRKVPFCKCQLYYSIRRASINREKFPTQRFKGVLIEPKLLQDYGLLGHEVISLNTVDKLQKTLGDICLEAMARTRCNQMYIFYASNPPEEYPTNRIEPARHLIRLQTASTLGLKPTEKLILWNDPTIDWTIAKPMESQVNYWRTAIHNTQWTWGLYSDDRDYILVNESPVAKVYWPTPLGPLFLSFPYQTASNQLHAFLKRQSLVMGNYLSPLITVEDQPIIPDRIANVLEDKQESALAEKDKEQSEVEVIITIPTQITATPTDAP